MLEVRLDDYERVLACLCHGVGGPKAVLQPGCRSTEQFVDGPGSRCAIDRYVEHGHHGLADACPGNDVAQKICEEVSGYDSALGVKGHAIGGRQIALLKLPASADRDDGAKEFSVSVSDRSYLVAGGELFAQTRRQNRLTRTHGFIPGLKDPGYGMYDEGSVLRLVEVEDVSRLMPERFSFVPTRELFGRLTHVDDSTLGVGCHHAVSQLRQQGCDHVGLRGERLLDFSAVKSRLDCYAHVKLVERFRHETVSAARFDPATRRPVVVCRQKDHGYAELVVDKFGGLDGIHLSLDMNVHQNHVGRVGRDDLRGLNSRICHRHDRVT